MKTVDLVKKYRHIFGTDYTQDANCKGAWLMELDEDPLTDSSGNGNTMALASAGNPNFLTTSPPAPYSTGYYDYNINSFTSTAQELIGTPKALSGVIWGFIDDPSPSTFGGRLFTERSATGWTLWLGDADDIYFFWTGSTHLRRQSDNAAFSEGEWEHFGFSHDGSVTAANCHIYVNGVEVTYQTTTDGVSLDNCDGNVTRIGREASGAPNTQIEGKFDEPAIFDRVLDSTEINDIMDNGLTGTVPSNPWPVAMLNKNRISGYHCFMDAYMRASREGYDPLKLPDGTIF